MFHCVTPIQSELAANHYSRVQSEGILASATEGRKWKSNLGDENKHPARTLPLVANMVDHYSEAKIEANIMNIQKRIETLLLSVEIYSLI